MTQDPEPSRKEPILVSSRTNLDRIWEIKVLIPYEWVASIPLWLNRANVALAGMEHAPASARLRALLEIVESLEHEYGTIRHDAR